MAHDFAAKPRPRKRSAAPPPPAPKRPARRLWLTALAALGALAGLGYLLYRLTGIQPDPAATQIQGTAPEPAPRKPAAAHPAPQPEPPRSEYDFYTLLPNSKVVPPQVEAYRSTPKSVENHQQTLLQAGSFRNAADAERMRAQLLLLGLPNVTSTPATSASGTVWHRVRVGPFDSRSQLNKAYDKLVRQNIQPLRIRLP